MKKILGILVLGLLLASCSEMNEKKKSKNIEKCADFEYFKVYEAPSEEVLSKMSINAKLKVPVYENTFAQCEDYLKKNPQTFKEKYLK